MLSPSHQQGVTQQLCRAELPDRVKYNRWVHRDLGLHLWEQWEGWVPLANRQRSQPRNQAWAVTMWGHEPWLSRYLWGPHHNSPQQVCEVKPWPGDWNTAHRDLLGYATPRWVIVFLLDVPQWSYGRLGGAAQSAGSPWALCQVVSACFGPLSLSME